MRSPWLRIIVVTLACLAWSAPPLHARQAEGLEPSFGDGRLTITGGGFKPNERVTLSVRTGGATQQFTTTADARGRFRLETGLAVQPGSSVALEARGDQGTTQAAITSAPPGLPIAPGPPAPAPVPTVSPPRQLPRVGEAAGDYTVGALALGGVLVAAGLALRRRAARSR